MHRLFLFLCTFLFPVLAPAQTNETPIATAEIEVNLPIPDDATPLQTSITVPGSGLIEHIEIALRLLHDAVEELRISITSPTGLTTVLHNQTPSDQNPFNPVYESVTPSAGSLSVFQNLNAQGTWTLTVEDNGSGNTGTFEAWGIRLSPARVLDPPPPTPVPILPGTEFVTTSAFIPDVSAGGIQCLDANQDGMDDLLLFSTDADSVAVFTSNGTDFNPPRLLSVSNPRLAATGDLNRDGLLDMVIGSDAVAEISSIITVFIATPEGGYSKGFTAEVQTALRTLAVFDANQDSLPDIVLGGEPFLLAGEGNGSFQPPRIFVHLGRDFFAATDINRDSFQDIFVSISRGGTSTNKDPFVILLDADNPSQFSAQDGVQVRLDGIFLQSGSAATRQPGVNEFVILSESQEAEPVQLLTTVRSAANGEIISTQSRLAPDTIVPPFTPFDINGDGLDEFVFASSSGILSFQKDPGNVGGNTRVLSPRMDIQWVCPGLFFADGKLGLAAVTVENEVLLMDSNLGERPTPPQFITPTPTPTSALFITPTPLPPTPTPQATPTPPPGLQSSPDLNGDGRVDKLDLLLLIQSWNSSP